jgi:hypothetical protein
VLRKAAAKGNECLACLAFLGGIRRSEELFVMGYFVYVLLEQILRHVRLSSNSGRV